MKNELKTLNTIGLRIRAAREARGLSQSDLAKELGFQTATAISLIESGERKLTAGILERLSEVLHRDIKYFLGQDEDAPVNVQVALRADPDLTKEDKDAILRFIDLAKNKNKNERKRHS
jgi:transcriptional regulator with XRE-family HTH domain